MTEEKQNKELDNHSNIEINDIPDIKVVEDMTIISPWLGLLET